MERIIFINSKGQSVELGYSAPFILTKIEGTGAVNVNIQSSKSPYQDGVSYHGNTLEPRSLSIEIMIIAENIEEMMNYRRKLSNIFNPKLNEGTLIYEISGVRREIKAISELAPVFPDAGDFKDTMQPGLIQLYCPNPFWLDTFIESEEMADWVGGLRFPLQLPMMFAGRSTRQSTIIRNDGDVPTPITFEFLGPAVNPKVVKDDTGEYIQVNREIGEDEKLIVSTGFGDKRVILQNRITGEETNAFWLD